MRPSFDDARRIYANRYTLEHIPAWARGTADNGRHYAPSFRTDAEWYAAATFPGEPGGPAANASHMWGGSPTWPLGQWLNRSLPYADARLAASDDAALAKLAGDYAWRSLEGFDSDGIAYNLTNYSGHRFDDFEPRKNETGPGWIVIGRNREKYGTDDNGRGLYVATVAWPDKPRRKCPNYNGRVIRGWSTRRDAAAVADRMNAACARLA